MTDQLHRLIAQWRARAVKDYAIRHEDVEDGVWAHQHEAAGSARAANQCAGELEALLAERPQPQEGLIASWRRTGELSRNPAYGICADELVDATSHTRDDWRAMDTAPKDGTSVLLAYQIHNLQCVTVGWFTTGYWRDEEATDLGPTHWMPLPDPPLGSPTP